MAISKFKKDLGVSTTSSIISFAISLGLSPIMTRLYNPEDYGVFSLINTIGMFVATLALFSIQSAFSIEKSHLKKVQLLGLLSNIALLTFILVFITTLLLVLFIPSISWYFLLLPILILGAMLQRIFFSLSVSHEKFTTIAKARVAHPFIAKSFAIFTAFISQSSAVFLVFFESLGYFVQTFILFKNKETKNLRKYFSRAVDFKSHFTILKRYKSFASYYHMSNLMFIGFTMLQVLIISINYSEYETGLFSLASSMTSLPVQLLSLALASVLYAKMVKIYNNKENLFKFILKVILSFSIIGLIPYGIIYFFGTEIFSFVFGEKWSMSGTIAGIICFNIYLYFIFMPVEAIFRVIKKLKIKFIIDLVFLTTVISVFYYSTLSFTFITAIFYLSISLIMYYLFLTSVVIYFTIRLKYEITN